jgi:hypothetical protein
MKTIRIAEFRKDADELEFWIPHDYTCKMISNLRFHRYYLAVQIHISPMEGNQINRDQDVFFLHLNGEKKKRAEIKQSINEFCKNNGLELPTWPENY